VKQPLHDSDWAQLGQAGCALGLLFAWAVFILLFW